jgi:hypothetical protein
MRLCLTDTLADARTGKNGRHRLAGLLRQSVFGRLAGYEDVNDAERLCRDPAERVVGDRAIAGTAASASQMGRFETKLLSRAENLAALADLPGQCIASCPSCDHQRGSCSTWIRARARPTASRTAPPTTTGRTCHHPLFVFNQFGDVERCILRSGNVQAPTAGARYWNR